MLLKDQNIFSSLLIVKLREAALIDKYDCMHYLIIYKGNKTKKQRLNLQCHPFIYSPTCHSQNFPQPTLPIFHSFLTVTFLLKPSWVTHYLLHAPSIFCLVFPNNLYNCSAYENYTQNLWSLLVVFLLIYFHKSILIHSDLSFSKLLELSNNTS